MKKYLLIIGLLFTSLFSQSDDIPYDWSGQYGVISNNGRLMWNQDWRLGVLLIDGTVSNYPTRFGTSYKNNFVLSNSADFYRSLHTFPDSSAIKSKIDYYRGDFSYDQLEIEADFLEKTRVISINGFKRTYQGPYGQYIDSQGSNNPLQQSYRLDYSSKDKNENLDISIGYFITDSRLNLGDPADFIHKEKIVASGIGYSRDIATWQYNVQGAMFQQYYSMDYDSAKVYLNRNHFHQFVSKEIRNSTLFKLGMEFNNQALSFVESDKKNRNWWTIYGGWDSKNIGLKIGSIIGKAAIKPLFILNVKNDENNPIKWQSNLKYTAIPMHLFWWNETDEYLFEQWLISQNEIQLNWRKIPLNFRIDYSNVNLDDLVHRYYIGEDLIHISNNLLSSTISTQLLLIREWKLDVSYRHIFQHNLYSDGVGDRAQLGLIISENLFKNNLIAKLRLWGDAYLNHHQNLGFDGFHYGPYITDNANLKLSDYWVFNSEISAKISKMTIIWKVINILQTAESVTSRIFPDLNENYLLISNSNNFPPMNRFVTFHIIWDFEN